MKAFVKQASTRALGGTPAARAPSPPKVPATTHVPVPTRHTHTHTDTIHVPPLSLRQVYVLTPRRPSEGGPPQKPYIPPYYNPYGDDEESDDELHLPVTERLALFVKALDSKHAEEGRAREGRGRDR
jgi:hypothetical protein